jgi:hypothetical protein
VKVVQTPSIVQISKDGTARGFPISVTNTYNSLACGSATNSVIIGGDFTSINDEVDRCEENIAIWDCDDWVDMCLGFIGGPVNQLTSDGQGNTLVAGSFSSPCANIAIIYADGTTGCFPEYPGGEAYAIAAPFWAQVIVGDANGIYLQDLDGNWITYVTDGQVEAFAIDAAGNVYAVGQFTTVNGVQTGGVAIFNVNASGCIDITSGVWESTGFTFNGAVNSIDINKDTGAVYIGGEFTTITPLPVNVCQVSNGKRIDSNGSEQQLQFRQVAGNTYQLEAYYSNIIARNQAQKCFTNSHYVRITGQSSLGTNYSFLIGRHNATVNSISTVVVGSDTFYTIIYDVDVSLTIGEPCESLNEGLVEELTDSTNAIIEYAATDLPGGTGIDNTLSKLSAQCVFVLEQYQGDIVTVNYVAQMSGGNLLPMGNGVASPVNVIAVNPLTGEVYAGTKTGLSIWDGLFWGDFPGILGGSETTEVLDIDFCDGGCRTLILTNSNRASAVQGTTEVFYGGNAQPTDFNLVIHGPAKVESFRHNGSNNGMRFCTNLECNEIATLNFNSGKYDSNFRNNLAPSILGGSRYDICLNDCGPNDISMYMSEDDATTKATLLWREAHLGIESLCCKTVTSGLPTVGSQECVNLNYLAYHRDPTDEDCEAEGFTQGDLWHNAIKGCGLFLFTGDCEDCTEFTDGFITEEGATLTIDDSTVICPEDQDCEDLV